MNVTEIDDTLSRLRDASEAISANLLELDADPNRMLLESAALRGDTATRWEQANRTLVDMWKLLTRFTEVLDRAEALRGSRSRISPDAEMQIDTLLAGPSIELERSEIPLHQRAITSGREATTHCTPDELLDVMSTSFERAKEVIFGVSDVWERLVPRLRRAQVALDAATANAVGLGEEPDRQMQDLQRRLDEIGDLLVVDPLAADAAAIDALERDVEGVEGSFRDAGLLREALQPRIEAAHERLRRLIEIAAEAEAAHENTVVKIASPHVPPPVIVDRDVSDELDRVVALGHRGEWRAASSALEAWSDRAEALQLDVDACLHANLAPIEARNELRGRLDAYRAMAHDHGLIEDPELSRRYDRAHDALFTAPTDLGEAAALVRQYREAFPGDSVERKVPM